MPVGAAVVGLATAAVLPRAAADAVVLSVFLALAPAPTTSAAVAELVVLLAFAELLAAAGVAGSPSASVLTLFVAAGAPSVIARGLAAALAAVPVLGLRGVAVLVRAPAATTLLGVTAPLVAGAAAALSLGRPAAALLIARSAAVLLVAHPSATALLVAALLVPSRLGSAATLAELVAAVAVRPAGLPGSAGARIGFAEASSGLLALAAPPPFVAAVLTGAAAVLAGPAAVLPRATAVLPRAAAVLPGTAAVLPGTAAVTARVARRDAVDLSTEPAAVVVLTAAILAATALASPPLALVLASLALVLAHAAVSHVFAHGSAGGSGLVARAAEHAPVLVAAATLLSAIGLPEPPLAVLVLGLTVVLLAAPIGGAPTIAAPPVSVALLSATLLVAAAPVATIVVLLVAHVALLVTVTATGSVMVLTAPPLVHLPLVVLPCVGLPVAPSLAPALAIGSLRRSLSPVSFLRPHPVTGSAVTITLVSRVSTAPVARSSSAAVRPSIVGLGPVRSAFTSAAGGVPIVASTAARPALVAVHTSLVGLAATPFAVLFFLAPIVVVFGHGRKGIVLRVLS